MPDVSIIIVNWNTKDLLLSCVSSLKSNTHKTTMEIIVVDNASLDGSQDALRRKFPFVRLIQNPENLGFAKANNIGIQKSTGEYICLVNSDVEVKNACIDNMVAYMNRHSEIGIIGPKIYYPDGKVQFSRKRFPSLWNNFCGTFGLNRPFPRFKF